MLTLVSTIPHAKINVQFIQMFPLKSYLNIITLQVPTKPDRNCSGTMGEALYFIKVLTTFVNYVFLPFFQTVLILRTPLHSKNFTSLK